MEGKSRKIFRLKSKVSKPNGSNSKVSKPKG
jgi:hypothetical protein